MVYIPGDFIVAPPWLRGLRSDGERDRELHAFLQGNDPICRGLRAGWVDAFTMRMGVLGAPATPEELAAMGELLFATQGHIDPLDAADAEFLEWPPRDD
jgi:hypothetical protein